MRFLAITLIVHAPDPVTGVKKSTAGRFREVVGNALLAEELGFELFQAEIAPVLRREIPDPPWGWGPGQLVADQTTETPAVAGLLSTG